MTGLTEDLDSLSSNTSYTYKAYSDSSCSTEIATASAFLTKPGKPAKPVASVGAGTGKLILTSSVTGDGTLTEWEYQQKSSSDTDFGSWTDISSTSRSLSHTVSSLDDTKTYEFKVRAVNATGTGAASDASDAKAPAGITLTASEVSASGATLTIGNYNAAWWYEGDQSGATCTSVDAGTATATLSSLDAGTSYVYKAYSATGCNSTDLIATAASFITKPGKVAGVGAAARNEALAVTWTATTGAASYKVQWKSGNQEWDAANRQTTSTTASKTLSSLTNATEYTVRVAAVNASGDGAWSNTATGTPSGETLAASSVEATTATLTISNYGGSWYYKHTTPGSGTCSSVVNGATKDLTDLSSNTSYTYEAYSDSTCTTANKLATASAFLTKPGKPGKPVATVGAGTGKLTITASVTGDGAISKWQYQQKSDGDFGSWQNISSTAKSLSYTVGSLTDGTSYQFKVRAVNATGTGAASDASDAKSPAAPTLAGSSVEATTATLTISNWTGDWYYKYTSPSSGTCSSKVSAATKNLADLSGNTSYTFKAYSNSSCSTTLATASAFLTKPGKPSKPVASVGAGTGKLIVTASVTGDGTLTEWEYQQKSDGSFGSWEDISSTSKSLSHTVSSLTDGTSYQFKVRAVNATGTGVASDASDARSPAAVSLTAGEVSASGAKLTIANHNGAWWYEGDQSGATCTSVADGTTTATLSNLDAGASYVYKAYSKTGCNSGDLIATAPSFLTLPPKPATPTITTLSTKLKVSWSAVTSATSYKVQWKSGNENYNTGNRQATVSNGTAHTITGLTNSTTYTIRVTATNGTGDGAPSTEATGTPASQTLTVSEVSASGAKLTIGNHLDAWWYEGDQSGATCTSVSAGTTTATLSSLDAGTSYVYKAYSATGCDSDYLIATAASFLTKPAQVSGVAAAARDRSLAVSWSAVTSATSYKIQWKSGNQNFGTSRQTTSTTTSKSLGSLTNATEYSIRVAAVNGAGDGEWSETATGTPAGETLTVSNISATGATLTIANYGGDWYYKHTTPSSGQCSSKVSGLTATVGNLDSGTTYTFKAYSNSGCSTLVATAANFITKPGKVAGVGAAARNEALAVTWTATTGAASYKVQWKSGNQEWDASNRQTTSTTASKTLSSLTNATEYTVQVAAVNASGDGAWSDTATGTPSGETLAASSVSHNAATLTIGNYSGTWYYKADAAPHASCSSAVNTSATNLSSLAGNTSYTYEAYSDSSCTTANKLAAASAFLTKPAKPAKPTATANVGSGKLKLASSLTGGSGALTRWEYSKDNGTNWTNVSVTSTTLSHVVTALTNGTGYQFKVRAVNATGTGPTSDASTSVAPTAPTLTAGNVDDDSATLTIGKFTPDWYYKYTAPTGGDCSSNAVTTASVNLDSLSTNTNYTFKAYSDSSCATELTTASTDADFLTKPGKPTGLSAASGAGSGKLTLTASLSGDGTLTRWQYQQKKESDNNWGSWQNISSTSTSLSHVVSGLTNGDSYQFKVRAVNASGTGAASDASAAKEPADETLTASSITHNSATITIGNHAGDWYYKYTSPSGGTCSSNAVSTESEDLDSLSSNTSYTFKAYSNSACSAELATTTVLTKPGKPDKPTATAGAGSGKLTLASEVTGNGALSKWQYQQKEGNNNFGSWKDISSTSKTLGYTVSGLDNTKTYQFKVRAVNNTGNGLTSDASTAVAPSDETLAASKVEATTATLTISNYAGSWYYKYTSPSGGTCSSSAVSGGTKDLTGLDGNTSYTFKAYSDSGCSTELATASAFLTKPGKPNRPSAAAGAGSGKLTITSQVSGSGAISKWQYQQKEGNGNYGSWTNVTSATTTSLSYTVSGLTDGTNYQFKVRAVNATGEGLTSDVSAAVKPLDETLKASSVEATSATLTIGNYPGSWYYQADAAPDNTCKGPVSSGTSTQDLSGLSANTDYSYKAYSDSACNTELAAAPAFVTKPGKPTTLNVSLGGGGEIIIASSVSGDGTLTGWQYVKKEGENPFETNWSSISSTSATRNALEYTVSGLSGGVDYRFKVRAVNASGAGVESDESDRAAADRAAGACRGRRRRWRRWRQRGHRAQFRLADHCRPDLAPGPGHRAPGPARATARRQRAVHLQAGTGPAPGRGLRPQHAHPLRPPRSAAGDDPVHLHGDGRRR